jgi:hypothetical protein
LEVLLALQGQGVLGLPGALDSLGVGGVEAERVDTRGVDLEPRRGWLVVP